jgi:hypothetical protein
LQNIDPLIFGELTWAELDANFIAIKAALKLAVSMIPTDLGVTGLGSATLFDRFNSAYSHGNAAGLTKNNELIMWGSNRGYAIAAANVNAATATPPTAIKFPKLPWLHCRRTKAPYRSWGECRPAS